MSNTSGVPNKIHEGKNVKRFREMMGIKQEALAAQLGDSWSQKKISVLEGQVTIETNILEQVAEILKVTPEAIKYFDEQTAVNVISNTFHENAFINSAGTFNINPIEKWLLALEENKQLYERLLASEREKVEILKSR